MSPVICLRSSFTSDRSWFFLIMSWIKSSIPDLVTTFSWNWASFAAESITHNPDSELLSDSFPNIGQQFQRYVHIWDWLVIFLIWKNFHTINAMPLCSPLKHLKGRVLLLNGFSILSTFKLNLFRHITLRSCLIFSLMVVIAASSTLLPVGSKWHNIGVFKLFFPTYGRATATKRDHLLLIKSTGKISKFWSNKSECSLAVIFVHWLTSKVTSRVRNPVRKE